MLENILGWKLTVSRLRRGGGGGKGRESMKGYYLRGEKFGGGRPGELGAGLSFEFSCHSYS